MSYCSVCDAPLFRGRVVALAGVGELGLHAATVLSKFVRKCYWVFPGPDPGADPSAVEGLLSKGVVELVPRSRVVEIRGRNRVRSVVVREERAEQLRELEVDGVFIEMGYAPKTEFLRGLVELNERGEVVVNKLCETSCPGIFAAGDVTDVPYKQAVISAGQGAVAALSAYNYVARLRGLRRVTRDWRHVETAGASGEGLLRL
ncbi:MAG: hypothetical protein DRJ56_05840 [Thermoprotei archaeon]|nr:MAG: hypothetical protein DRJ56_05840 [Thermoprotei archaeon]